MTSNPSNSTPPFPTPNPDDLQDRETQASVREKLTPTEAADSDAIDSDRDYDSTPDPDSLLGASDDVALRQSGTIGLSGG